jgi:hypothetical protein
VFHETNWITNPKQLITSVTLFDYFLMELGVDGTVNIVCYNKLSNFRADIAHVTLLLCLYQLRVFLIQYTLRSKQLVKYERQTETSSEPSIPASTSRFVLSAFCSACLLLLGSSFGHFLGYSFALFCSDWRF